MGRPSHGPVFPVTRGPRKGEAKATGNHSYAKRLRAALLAAGVTRHELHHETQWTRPTDFHNLRRSFNTALARAGVNVQTAMQCAGHSDPKVHMRYVAQELAKTPVPDAALPAIGSLSASLRREGGNPAGWSSVEAAEAAPDSGHETHKGNKGSNNGSNHGPVAPGPSAALVHQGSGRSHRGGSAARAARRIQRKFSHGHSAADGPRKSEGPGFRRGLLERETGIEPATPSLGSSCSTS